VSNPIDPRIPPQQEPDPATGGGAPQPAGPPNVATGQPAAAQIPGQPATSPAGPAAGFDTKGRVRRTRSGGAWVGLITAAVFLILLVIFIAQNNARVSIKFLRFNGHMSLGLMILISAIVGLLIAAVPGSIRILQLRRALKRNTPPGQRSGS
jgi:putative membrane protein